MKNLRYLLFAALSVSYAMPAYSTEQTVFSAVDEAELDVEARDESAGLARRFALALTGSLVGRPSEAVYRADGSHPFSDYGAAAEGRYYFSENIAVGLSMSVMSRISRREMDTGSGEFFHVHPTLFGARYQWSSALRSSNVKPYFQLEAGPTWIERSFDYEPYSTEGQLTARGSGGVEVYFSGSTSTFAGFQLSYLRSKDLAFAQTTLSLGLVF